MMDRMITAPPNARMLVVPHEYLAICVRQRTGRIARGKRKSETFIYNEPDEAAAALLYLVERWSLYKMKESGGKLEWKDTWIYMSLEQIQDYELCRAFGTRRIVQGFALLEQLKFISRRHNPDNPSDRTLQYRFELDTVQEAVDKLPPFFNFEEWKFRNRKMQASKSKNASFDFERTIPHDPTQNPEHDPTQRESLPDAHAREDDEPAQSEQKAASVSFSESISDLSARSSNVFREYERHFHGSIGPGISDQLKKLEEDYPAFWIIAAIAEAAESGGRSVRYIESILARWEKEGLPTKLKADGPLPALFGPLCQALGYMSNTLTAPRKAEVAEVARQLEEAGATAGALSEYRAYLDWRARQENWSGYGLNAVAKYWPDFVAAKIQDHKPAKHPPLTHAQMLVKARLFNQLVSEGKYDEARALDYWTVIQEWEKEQAHHERS